MEENNSKISENRPDLDTLWDPVNPAASEAKYREFLPNAQLLMGNERAYLCELLSLIGRSEALQGKLPEAHATLEEAERVLNASQANEWVTARIRCLLERGRLYVLKKTPSQARNLLAQSWTLATQAGDDYFIVDIAKTMAAIENPKAQQEWIVRAIEIAEKSSMPKAKHWLGGLYTSLGWKLYDLRQYEKSLEVFHKALGHLRAQGTKREAFVAKWSTGKVLRVLGKTAEALEIQRALLAELGIGGERDGRLYEEIAECLQTLNRSTEAQLYFELAYRELSESVWVNDNQPLKLKRMKDLGKVK